MRLEQFQQIIEIDNKKSITEAAKSLSLGQPQLSNSLKNLESKLGYRIFKRHKAGLVPTCQGREVLQLARKLLNVVDEVKALSSRDGDLESSLRIMLGPIPFNAFAAPLQIRFNSKYPNVQLLIREGFDEDIAQEVGKGEYVLGVACFMDDQVRMMTELLEGRNLVCEKLAQDDLGLLVGSGHPLAAPTTVRLSDLEDTTFIDYHGLQEGFFRRLGIQSKGRQFIPVHERGVWKAMIARNQGVALSSRLFLHDDLYSRRGLLQVKPLVGVTEKNRLALCLIYPGRDHLSHLAQQLVKMIKEAIPHGFRIEEGESIALGSDRSDSQNKRAEVPVQGCPGAVY